MQCPHRIFCNKRMIEKMTAKWLKSLKMEPAKIVIKKSFWLLFNYLTCFNQFSHCNWASEAINFDVDQRSIISNLFFSFPAILILFLGLTSQIFATRTVNNFLSKSDQDRLQSVFQDGIKSNDLQSIYYSALNLKSSLQSQEKTEVCGRLAASYADSKLNVSNFSKLPQDF